MEYTDFAKAVLKEHSYRLTEARLLVMEVLSMAKKPLNAYEIANCIPLIGDSVDVSTVYRILEVFKQLNLVHFNAQMQRYSACKEYDCDEQNHCHHEFVCKKCEQAIEIHIDDRKWISMLGSINKNLEINSHYLELSGLCSECK